MSSPSNNNKDIWRYAGLASQILVSLGLAVWAGVLLDKRVKLSFPIFSCALPLLVIAGLIVNLIKQAGRKRNDK
jgi:carbon starvation protein CstA